MFRFEIPGQARDPSPVDTLASDVATLKAQVAGLSDATSWIKLVTDGKACAKRAEELNALMVQAIDETSKADAARAALASEKAAQDAELDQRRAELDAYAARQAEREGAIAQTRKLIFGAVDEVRLLDAQMRRAVMSYGGLLSAYNPAIQSMPSWETLDRDLLGKSDAYVRQVADGEFSPAADEAEIGPVMDAVAGATLARSVPTSRSMRRVPE